MYKDITKTMDIYDYIKALMTIPVDHRPISRYNGSGGGSCGAVLKFSKYRSILLRENKLRLQIKELLALIAHAEKTSPDTAKALNNTRLRDMVLELSKLTIRRRELEKLCRDIQDDLARQVVSHRYFDDPHSPMVPWGQTAAELGIALSGTDLRRYVTMKLSG